MPPYQCNTCYLKCWAPELMQANCTREGPCRFTDLGTWTQTVTSPPPPPPAPPAPPAAVQLGNTITVLPIEHESDLEEEAQEQTQGAAIGHGPDVEHDSIPIDLLSLPVEIFYQILLHMGVDLVPSLGALRRVSHGVSATTNAALNADMSLTMIPVLMSYLSDLRKQWEGHAPKFDFLIGMKLERNQKTIGPACAKLKKAVQDCRSLANQLSTLISSTEHLSARARNSDDPLRRATLLEHFELLTALARSIRDQVLARLEALESRHRIAREIKDTIWRLKRL